MRPIIECTLAVVGFMIFLAHLVGPARLDKLWQRFLLALVNFLGRLSVQWLGLLYRVRQHLLR